jgi:arginine deiminase
MHLDTVFTPVDRDAALVYPPVLEGPERAQVYEIDLRAHELEPSLAPPLLEAARKRGLELEPIPCGGADPVCQQREQWTDGANALAVAPGVVVLYDRNVKTAEALAERGFKVIEAEDVLLGREEVTLDGSRRTCVLLSSTEISRARGGPHCLTHPLERDELR